MDETWAIKLAKTEFREGFNTGDSARVLSVFADGFIDMSAGQPGFYGPEARVHLSQRLDDLFAEYHVRMFMMIAEIAVSGDIATDWGWHKMWLTPKSGGEIRFVRLRYSEQWIRVNGDWKILLLLTAPDIAPRLGPLNEAEVLRAVSVCA